jgi:hypothetical protein
MGLCVEGVCPNLRSHNYKGDKSRILCLFPPHTNPARLVARELQSLLFENLDSKRIHGKTLMAIQARLLRAASATVLWRDTMSVAIVDKEATATYRRGNTVFVLSEWRIGVPTIIRKFRLVGVASNPSTAMRCMPSLQKEPVPITIALLV